MTQEEALDILKMGHSAFVTGPAGSGKTYVVNQYISWLRDHDVWPAITASTGIAATHIGGQTIHSWSGIGIKDSVDALNIDRLEQNKAFAKKLRSTKVLVIDEVSMLGAHQLDMVNEVLKVIRRSDEPFGGLQVIFSGDFFQLPPVTRGGERPIFAFESAAWDELTPVVCHLESQHRQIDGSLLQVLSDIRDGEVSELAREALEQCRQNMIEDDAQPTRIYTHNVDVDAENLARLETIDGEARTFHMSRIGNKRRTEMLVRGCLAPEELELKVGARVMFVKNDPGGTYVNGTLGEVVDFEDDLPYVALDNGGEVLATRVSWQLQEDDEITAEIMQVPLRLAWAITVHKSQGMTLDSAVIDLSRTFVPGQGYVALSRVRTLDGLSLTGWNERALSIEPRVREVTFRFQDRSKLAQDRLGKLERNDIDNFHNDHIIKSEGTLKKKKGGAKPTRAIQKKDKRSTYEITRELLNSGKNVAQIAKERGLNESTIRGHLDRLAKEGSKLELKHLLPSKKKQKLIEEAFSEVGLERLKPVKEYLEEDGHHVTYDDIGPVRLKLWLKGRK